MVLIKVAPEVHADETGFGTCSKKRMWLWVGATEDAEAFHLLPGRGREQAMALLGEGCKDLLRQWDSLWTYLHRSGSVPTNNHAERSIRKAVLWRKISLGADSEGGCRFVERMLTVAGTARKRGIDLLDWLSQALQAKNQGLSVPTLRG